VVARDNQQRAGPSLGPGGRGAQAVSAACPLAAGPAAQAGARSRPWAIFPVRAEKGVCVQ
jgi:hypothetical protein